MEIIQRILMPEIFDIIANRFGQPAYCLTSTSFFYGGAVRDAVAGMPLRGDLDIAVVPMRHDLNLLQDNIVKCPGNWRRSYAQNVEYNGNANPLIASVRTFCEERTSRIVQIMSVMVLDRSVSTLDNVLKFVQSVDICCCGLALDCWGFLYEMVPGAIEDCKNHVLRYNPRDVTPNGGEGSEIYRMRTAKLMSRGWTPAAAVKDRAVYDWGDDWTPFAE